jgi:hypothetical protein
MSRRDVYLYRGFILWDATRVNRNTDACIVCWRSILGHRQAPEIWLGKPFNFHEVIATMHSGFQAII